MGGVSVTISAKTMEGLPAADPSVMMKIDEVQPFQRTLGTQQVANFEGQVVLEMAAPGGGGVEWMVTPTLSRYMAPGGQMFLPNANPEPAFALQLTRLPSAWKARFTPYAALSSPRFDRFKQVVSVSTHVDLKAAGVPPVGNLEQNYDAIDLEPQILAKTALLNLYAVLTDEFDPIGDPDAKVPWFSYVQKIVRIDQERFIAEVDKTLFDHVSQIVANLGAPFLGGEYSTEPESDFALHTPNIPPQYDPANNIAKMVTVKKKYEQGDVQLTMTQLKTGPYLLDCDMDEHLEIVAHTGDLVVHAAEELEDPTDTGTHPFLMHEYIVRDSAQQAADGIATVDLGYVLV